MLACLSTRVHIMKCIRRNEALKDAKQSRLLVCGLAATARAFALRCNTLDRAAVVHMHLSISYDDARTLAVTCQTNVLHDFVSLQSATFKGARRLVH